MIIEYDKILKIWGKTEPYQPLLYHMIDAGNVALSLLSTPAYSIIAKKFSEATGCPIEACKPWLAYLVALHDIGKCDPDFQAKGSDDLIKPLKDIDPNLKIRDLHFRHEARSGEWIKDHLKEKHGWDRRAFNTVSNAIRGHHSNFEVPNLNPAYGKWNEVRNVLAEHVRYVFNPQGWSPEKFKNSSSTGLLLSGLIVFSDWISSNIELMNPDSDTHDILEYARVSREKAQKAVSRLGLFDDINWSDKTEFNQIWTSSEFLNPRPIQQKCVEICRSGVRPGLVIIEAPMGEGKTEAAIYLATMMMASRKSEGMYIALPTAATSNQMYGRVKAFLNMHDDHVSRRIKLVNGMAWMIDDDTLTSNVNIDDRDSIEWFKPKKRSLLTPYSVGTIDQALMSALNVRFGFLRLFGLSSKVLIIDEVHAYDAYMSSILVTLLKWCSVLDIPVIMLSATLPEDKKKILIDAYRGYHEQSLYADKSYPLITYVDNDGNVKEEAVTGQSRQIRLELVKHSGMMGDHQAIARLACEIVDRGGCLCVILNTVKSAQNVYAELEKQASKDTIILLYHSRFRAKDRSAIENTVLSFFDRRSLSKKDTERMERPKKAILVATQVIEQSLDLDFDAMITEIAPIDLLLQRAGRLHRHPRPSRPTGDTPCLHVLLPSNGVPVFQQTEKVYSRFTLLKTLLTLSHKQEISLPQDIKSLVDIVYNGDTYSAESLPYEISEDDLRDAHKEMLKEMEEKAAFSNQYLISDPRPSEYSIALMQYACKNNEDEGGQRSYFNARTRIGDENVSLILLDEDDFKDIIEKESAPPRGILKQIFLNMVNVPDWWLKKYTVADGYEPLLNDKTWLAHTPIMRLRSSVWEGVDHNGKRFKIIKDERLGIVRTEMEE
jgi:CRISPR-associated endonuclease/helicase Cas3